MKRERGTFNRNARRSGGDRYEPLLGPSIGLDAAVLLMQIRVARERLGQDGVNKYLAELRTRGDLDCTDHEAQELAKP